jgi:hypothetical protein
MKVEEEGVHHYKYEGHYMKQRIKIPTVTLTSPILGRRSTCRTSFITTYLMYDDGNDEMSNGIPKTLIPSNGVVNWDGVLKSNDKLHGDHATHL